MNELRQLEKYFGGWWCGIIFGRPKPDVARREQHPMRFCQAVAAARRTPVLLDQALLDCPGGRRALGWNRDIMGLARAMAEKNGMSISAAQETIQKAPCLEDGFTEISLGAEDNPDIAISYAQP